MSVTVPGASDRHAMLISPHWVRSPGFRPSAYWKFEEDDGEDLIDSIHQIHLVGGGGTRVDGKIESALNFQTDLGQITPNIHTSGEVVYFKGGESLPAGVYRITYVNGALKYRADEGWALNSFGDAYEIVWTNSNGPQLHIFPGTHTLLFPDQHAVEVANAGAELAVSTNGGPIGMFQFNLIVDDNVDGSPNPTFKLYSVISLDMPLKTELALAGKGWTMAAWVKINLLGSGDGIRLVWSNEWQGVIELAINSSRVLTFGLTNATADDEVSYLSPNLATLELDQWYFIVAIGKSDGHVSVLLNDEEILSADPGFSMARSTYGTAKLSVDARGSDVTLDEWGLWLKRPLSSAAATSFYNNGDGKRPPL